MFVGFIPLLFGCQTGNAVKPDSGGFMNLWNTYAHCHAETDLEQLKHDASVLSAAANQSLSAETFVIPLPGQIERLVTTPSARLAVDVKAMAASCSLRAGQAAVNMGKIDIARSLLQSILDYHPEADYAYYSMQAKSMLLELDSAAVKVSLRIP